MAKPVVTQNVLPTTINVGGSADWRTVATDPDAGVANLTRPVQDSQGNVTVISKTVTISDPLTYGPPTCDNPNVSLVVDALDPTLVHVTVNSAP